MLLDRVSGMFTEAGVNWNIHPAILLLVLFCSTAVPFRLLSDRLRPRFLLLVSVCFYALASSVFELVQLLAISVCIYILALKVSRSDKHTERKKLVGIGLTLLVGNLLIFKYAGFLSENLSTVFRYAGISHDPSIAGVVLPLGSSFYTLQLVSYLVDVYRGEAAERSTTRFFLYVAFFPKIISGPIERARGLLTQLRSSPRPGNHDLLAGAQRILLGLLKKIIADRIGVFVDRVYDSPGDDAGSGIAFATWLYAFQIYFDFSGYSDIAIGAARMFGVRLTENFDRPYFARSVQEFWKRWHRSFSSWLTDYVYAPLLRQRAIKGKLHRRMMLSILATFVLSGVWHGAAWNFVVWGLLHGGYLVLAVQLAGPWSIFTAKIGLTRFPKAHHCLHVARTFTLVCFGYVFFRANSLSDAMHLVGELGTGWMTPMSTLRRIIGADTADFILAMSGIVILMGYELLPVKLRASASSPEWISLRWLACGFGGMLVLTLTHYYGSDRAFIYFQF
jgi:alginate O-acetyltransferase complex protein AlgI